MEAGIVAAVAAIIVVILMFVFVARTVRIVPQARARNIERFEIGRASCRERVCLAV